MKADRSETLFALARRFMPGGVSSPVRAFGSVGGVSPFIHRAEGARLWDEDGNEYLDLVGSWGPMILGHNHPAVVRAIGEALQDGVSFGAPTVREIELAKRVLERYPACEQLRFVNSGTEATMSALRLARGVTGRDKIIKFAGNYHGHADALLVAAGSGAMTTGVPSSAGVPADTAKHTLVARYNDPASLETLFRAHPGEIAAVIFEPVAGNMGVVAPTDGFLHSLRELTRENGALLIADEVMTGFRLARGGAVEHYGLEPDLVCWGKIIGGGLPVGAYGGKEVFMQCVSPLGKVYQAGTLSGNPLAMAAGIATLDALDELEPYERLEQLGQTLEAGLAEAAQATGAPVTINRVGSMLAVFFTEGPVTDYGSAKCSDTGRFAKWFHGLLEQGVYWPPSQFETAFLSCALEGEIDTVVEAARKAFKAR
jgi:glutamate-1-semialdehyde 2,1-aminomutase